MLQLVTALFQLLQVILPDERKEAEEEPQARESEAPDRVDGRFCSRSMLHMLSNIDCISTAYRLQITVILALV